MTGENANGSYGQGPEQQSTHTSAERVRQAQQAESGGQSGQQPGGEMEPRDSRNITGVGGAGTGSPGGADQQDGGPRWSGDAQMDLGVAAAQPDATTPEGQQPGIDRREMQAEQQAQQQAREQGRPQPGRDPGMSPEAQHMAAAHVPGQQQQQQQSMGAQGMSQSGGGMNQGFSAEEAARQPQQQGFVDQQTASMGGMDQHGGPGTGMGQQSQSAGGQGQQGGGNLGSDNQVESMIGVGTENLGNNAPGQQSQFAQGSGGQMGSGNAFAGQIREHMEVVGADEVHLGTVDAVDGDRIKLTKRDSDAGYEGGQHHGHHHYISTGLIAAVEGNRVRLSATAANAYAMEEEK